MSNQQVNPDPLNPQTNPQPNPKSNTLALAVGGILAGWEIDPAWTPMLGDTITIAFSPPAGVSRQVPVQTSITLGPFHILAAGAMRAGGQGLGATLQSAKEQAARWAGKGGRR